MSNIRAEHIPPALASSIIASVRSAHRVVALDAYRGALRRRDSRDQHHALQRLQNATTEALKAEVQPVKVKPWWRRWL